MNNEYAVRVEHAVVRFNMASERIDNLKEYFVKLVRRELMFKEFFALKDVSFEVKKGEAWGIIGTNGSGKSTLLKLICGILKPYKGKVLINGSIAPLIELGAGFDGDLTARENIFLNGAVLGYDKQFMEQHFDEIVDFAELWDFLDMPIKNYSSWLCDRNGRKTGYPDLRRSPFCRRLCVPAEVRAENERYAKERDDAFVCVTFDRIRKERVRSCAVAR